MNRMDENNSGLELDAPKSNAFLGLIGAILGALLGTVIWVVIYQLGYVASLAGLAIIFFSCKGYSMLGKGSDKKAAVIGTIVSLIVLVMAHFLCWGIDVSSEFGTTLMEGIILVPQIVFNSEIIAQDSSLIVGFFRDLAIGVVLIFVGAFGYGRSGSKSKSEELVEEESEII